jgi:hypothetical protein
MNTMAGVRSAGRSRPPRRMQREREEDESLHGHPVRREVRAARPPSDRPDHDPRRGQCRIGTRVRNDGSMAT